MHIIPWEVPSALLPSVCSLPGCLFLFFSFSLFVVRKKHKSLAGLVLSVARCDNYKKVLDAFVTFATRRTLNTLAITIDTTLAISFAIRSK